MLSSDGNQVTFKVSPVTPGDKTYPPTTVAAAGAKLCDEAQDKVNRQYAGKLSGKEYEVERATRKNEIDKAKAAQSELDEMIAQKKLAGEEAAMVYEFGATNLDLVEAKNYVKHGLISCVFEAYNNHLPLELSPDDFWVMMAQGVASFLGGNEEMAEKYRHTFVEHEGKEQLLIKMPAGALGPPGSPQNQKAWPYLANTFRDMIKKETATDLADVVTSDFTTTGDVERVVFSGTLMDTMKNYFEYKAMFMCGIPTITLHGTVKDYEDIIQRLKTIKSLFPDLDWWVTRVEEHMQKVIDTVRGKPNNDFWRKMVFEQPEGSGGQTRLSGWIGDFVPFIDVHGKQVQNKGTNLDDLPYGITLPDVILEDGMSGEKWQIKLATGFVGVHQDKETLALRPAMGWLTFYDHNSLKPAQT